MKKVSLAQVSEEEQRSPGGKFHSYCRNVSLALGGARNAGLAAGGHPFDVQIRRIPAGAAVCPFHAHLAQWELFVVQAGNGTVRAGEGNYPVKTGDVFIHPPGEPHQLINSSGSDLVVMIVADHPVLDACHYPDSKKWGLRPPGKFFRMAETDYLDGEDSPADPAVTKPYRTAGAPPLRPLSPFSERIIHPDAVAWEPWASPGGKFRDARKELSIKLGALRDMPSGLGGHPFDLELVKLAAGEMGCPYHSHANQWELFAILSGHGSIRTPDGPVPVVPGDVVLQQPGDCHQIRNSGGEDLVYFLIADNPAVDIWRYPDSNKWGFKSPRKFFRISEADYWDGEE